MTNKEAMKQLQAILDEATETEDSVCYVTSEDADVLRMAIKALEGQQWIPCSERLPDKETYVIISKKPHPLTGKKWCVTIAGRFVDERNRKIVWLDIGFGRIADDEILAWMPFPELYRKEKR